MNLARLLSLFLANFTRIPYSDRWIGSLFGRWRTHAWIVAPPKTGSTWLSQLLSSGLNWTEIPLVPTYYQREQEIDLTRIPAKAGFFGNVLSPHQHCRYHPHTQRGIDAARIKVIFLTRNLFDCLVSFRDHLENESRVWPMAFMDDANWDQLDDDARMDFVIDMVAPWYFNFYAGWLGSPMMHSDRLLHVTYEDLRADPAGTVRAIYDFLKVRKPYRSAEDAVADVKSKRTRLNKGVSGRGGALSDAHRERILKYAAYYPTIDFSIVGLPAVQPLPDDRPIEPAA